MPDVRQGPVGWHRLLCAVLISLGPEAAAFAADPPNFPPRVLPPAPQLRAPPPSSPPPPRRAAPAAATLTEETALVDVMMPVMSVIALDTGSNADGDDDDEAPVTGYGNDAMVDAGLLVDPAARLR